MRLTITLSLVLSACSSPGRTCGAGTVEYDGICVPVTVGADGGTSCGAGTRFQNGECVAVGSDGGSISCGPGTVLVGATCVVLSGDGGSIVCGPGTVLIGTTCVVTDGGTAIVCGPGTSLVGSTCVVIGGDGGSPCGPGTTSQNGVCIPTADAVPPLWRRLTATPALTNELWLTRQGRYLLYAPAIRTTAEGPDFQALDMRVITLDGGAERSVPGTASMACQPIGGQTTCMAPGKVQLSNDERWVYFSTRNSGLLVDLQTATATALSLVGEAVFAPTSDLFAWVQLMPSSTSTVRVMALPSLTTYTLRTSGPGSFAKLALGTSDAGVTLFHMQPVTGGGQLWALPLADAGFARQIGTNVTLEGQSLSGRLLVRGLNGPPFPVSSVESDGTGPRALLADGFGDLSPGKTRLLLLSATGSVTVTDADGLGTPIPISVQGPWGWETDDRLFVLAGNATAADRLVFPSGTLTTLPAPFATPVANLFAFAHSAPSGSYVERCRLGVLGAIFVNGASVSGNALNVYCGEAGHFYPASGGTTPVSTVAYRTPMGPIGRSGFVGFGPGAIDATGTFAIANVLGIDGASSQLSSSSGLYLMPVP